MKMKRGAEELKEIEDEIEFSEEEDSSSDDGSDTAKSQEIINVDFDFFDLNPDVDFHGLRTFLKQLFGDDYKKFDLSGISNLILDPKKTSIGSSVKTDGKEGDPLGLLALVSLADYKKTECLKTVVDYCVKKSQTNTNFYLALKKALNVGKGEKVGLIFNERIINVPVEVSPPMFKFMMEEVEKQEPKLDHFVIISKAYKLVASELSDDEDEEEDRRKKVKKNKKDQQEFEHFHDEDIFLEKNSVSHGLFRYDNKLQDTDARRVFTDYGIDPHLSLILLTKKGLENSVNDLEANFGV